MNRLTVAVALLSVAALFATTTSLAAAPEAATYAGQIKREGATPQPIRFAVSKNKKKVTDFSFPSSYPVYCQGGGFGTPVSKPAKISAQGAFTAKLPLVFAPRHQNQGVLIVTGTFTAQGKVKGSVTTDFKAVDNLNTCNGTSAFSARAN
jgi:hypothetical protein